MPRKSIMGDNLLSFIDYYDIKINDTTKIDLVKVDQPSQNALNSTSSVESSSTPEVAVRIVNKDGGVVTTDTLLLFSEKMYTLTQDISIWIIRIVIPSPYLRVTLKKEKCILPRIHTALIDALMFIRDGPALHI